MELSFQHSSGLTPRDTVVHEQSLYFILSTSYIYFRWRTTWWVLGSPWKWGRSLHLLGLKSCETVSERITEKILGIYNTPAICPTLTPGIKRDKIIIRQNLIGRLMTGLGTSPTNIMIAKYQSTHWRDRWCRRSSSSNISSIFWAGRSPSPWLQLRSLSQMSFYSVNTYLRR